MYNEVSELIQSALDGYHVCIMSYGQTGGGTRRCEGGRVSQHQGEPAPKWASTERMPGSLML